MTTDLPGDLEQLNQIARYRNRLDDIRQWLPQLNDTMTTITAYCMSLAPTHTTAPQLPGGDALAMRAPYAPNADHGDDLPHPQQIIREWVETLDGQPRRAWAENWRRLHDLTPHILESPWAPAWRTDIDALWWRLARLTGNAPDITPPPTRSIDDVWEALEENPDYELTRRDLTLLGVNPSTVTTWRHRGKITETRPGRYRAGDILHARRTA